MMRISRGSGGPEGGHLYVVMNGIATSGVVALGLEIRNLIPRIINHLYTVSPDGICLRSLESYRGKCSPLQSCDFCLRKGNKFGLLMWPLLEAL